MSPQDKSAPVIDRDSKPHITHWLDSIPSSGANRPPLRRHDTLKIDAANLVRRNRKPDLGQRVSSADITFSGSIFGFRPMREIVSC
jgi:hypothetical protein